MNTCISYFLQNAAAVWAANLAETSGTIEHNTLQNVNYLRQRLKGEGSNPVATDSNNNENSGRFVFANHFVFFFKSDAGYMMV